ncbi:MAG TPA: hypothetical protein DD381_05065 [Lentisphaeria bacterium]|nr:MAG: hypothetical protein A2X47_06350 [Lentisphaerae bacterium GWF2_38_69]HBM15701.1 hypothetical protein [Lentisphaeria bacterium]
MFKRFSLVELMAVVAIIGIIMAITLPAFLTMTKGQAVELATREIGSKLKAVRSYAITKRVYCALIFVTNQTVLSQNYPYKSYRACIVNSSNVFQGWVPDEKWDFFPTGTIIQDISTTTAGYNGGTFVGAADITSVTDAKVLSSSQTFKGIIFRSTGDVVGSDAYLVIGEGEYTSNTVARHNTANMAIIHVDNYTGRISYGTQ